MCYDENPEHVPAFEQCEGNGNYKEYKRAWMWDAPLMYQKEIIIGQGD